MEPRKDEVVVSRADLEELVAQGSEGEGGVVGAAQRMRERLNAPTIPDRVSWISGSSKERMMALSGRSGDRIIQLVLGATGSLGSEAGVPLGLSDLLRLVDHLPGWIAYLQWLEEYKAEESDQS